MRGAHGRRQLLLRPSFRAGSDPGPVPGPAEFIASKAANFDPGASHPGGVLSSAVYYWVLRARPRSFWTRLRTMGERSVSGPHGRSRGGSLRWGHELDKRFP